MRPCTLAAMTGADAPARVRGGSAAVGVNIQPFLSPPGGAPQATEAMRPPSGDVPATVRNGGRDIACLRAAWCVVDPALRAGSYGATATAVPQ